jgi:hypothetical protein
MVSHASDALHILRNLSCSDTHNMCLSREMTTSLAGISRRFYHRHAPNCLRFMHAFFLAEENIVFKKCIFQFLRNLYKVQLEAQLPALSRHVDKFAIKHFCYQTFRLLKYLALNLRENLLSLKILCGHLFAFNSQQNFCQN